jgi:ribosomal protein S18 acetylase RimI-like enzyme
LNRTYLSVNKDQIAAVKLYEKCGFKVTSFENQILGDGVEHQEFIMEKTLD